MSARYVFDHKGKKTQCPECHHQRTFRRYVDLRTGELMAENIGICDRETNCGYHYTPTQWFSDRGLPTTDEYRPEKPITHKMKRTDWRCPQEAIGMTSNNAGNVFAIWLTSLLGEPAKNALRAYKCGTAHFPMRPDLDGAMVFFQIGLDGLRRSAKVIPYGSNGKRIKEAGAAWLHSIVYGKNSDELGLSQVLFGSHLLKERPDAPVCILESEKSAIIASCFYPGYVWLATGGSNGLTADKCSCLSGSSVTLFPDMGCETEWHQKALDIGLDAMCELSVDDTLVKMGAELGSDIADYLLPERTLPELFANSTERITPGIMETVRGYVEGVGMTDIPIACLPEGHKRPSFDWNAPDKPAKHSDQSPIERVFGSEGMKSLVEQLDIDLNQATIKPLK